MNTGTDTYYLNSSEITSAINSYETYLSDVSTQSSNVMSTLDDFSNSSMNILIGDTWDEIRGNLDKYSDCLEVSEAINSEIIATNSECLKMIQDFLHPDNDLNTADLPKYEAEKTKIEKDIADLKSENNELDKVPEKIKVQIGTNEFGSPIYEEQHNPAYDEAQVKIAANNNKITNELTPALNETNRLIDKINKFNNEILPAVMKKLEESEKNLKLLMDKVDKIGVSALKSYSPKTGKAEKTYDLNTREGRFLYIYDQLTEKYGYSEWGAKAILAQMYGTNDQFLSNRFQSDLPTNAGYGLCQWEYKKYGGTVDDAQWMENWCRSKGLDHTSIDGQLAWLDHYLPIKCADYKDPECYNKFKTATEADYYELVCKFGTYHQGTQGDQNKNYYRAYNGNLLYKLFPLIEERDSYKTATATSLSSSPKTDVAATTKTSDSTAGNAYIPSTSSSSSASSAATATALAASTIPVSAAVASYGLQSNNSNDNYVPYNTLSSISSTSTLSNNYMYNSTNSSPNVVSSNNRESVYDIGIETGISTDTASKTELSNKTVPVYEEIKKSDNDVVSTNTTSETESLKKTVPVYSGVEKTYNDIVNTNITSETEPSSNIKTVFEERKEYKSEPVKTNTTYKYEPVSSNDIESIIEEDESDNGPEDIIGTYYTASSNNPDSVYIEERKDNNTESVDNKEITTTNNNSNNKNNNTAKTILTAVGTTAAIGAAAGAAIYGVKQSKKNNDLDEDEVFEK